MNITVQSDFLATKLCTVAAMIKRIASEVNNKKKHAAAGQMQPRASSERGQGAKPQAVRVCLPYFQASHLQDMHPLGQLKDHFEFEPHTAMPARWYGILWQHYKPQYLSFLEFQ